jgi:hypothetical protein
MTLSRVGHASGSICRRRLQLNQRIRSCRFDDRTCRNCGELPPGMYRLRRDGTTWVAPLRKNRVDQVFFGRMSPPSIIRVPARKYFGNSGVHYSQFVFSNQTATRYRGPTERITTSPSYGSLLRSVTRRANLLKWSLRLRTVTVLPRNLVIHWTLLNGPRLNRVDQFGGAIE